MPDLFDQYEAKQKQAAPAKGGDLFDQYEHQENVKKKQLSPLADSVPGFLKAPVEALEGATNTIGKDFGNLVGMLPGKAGEYGRRFAEMTPEPAKTTAGSIGSGVGNFMEYEMAGRGVGKFLKGAPDGAGLARRVLTSSVKAGAEAGLVGTAQTGSVKEGARQAAFAGVTAPAVNELARAASPLLKKAAQKAYQRFLIPGGGPGYNKEVASKAAEELIKKGTFALTKGGFTRTVETHVQDANIEIEKIEDDLLNRLGYSPTGTGRIHVTQEPYTRTTGPTIDVNPIEETGGVPARITKEVGFPERGVGPHTPLDEGTSETRTRNHFSWTEDTRQGMIDAKPVLKVLNEAQARNKLSSGDPVEGYQGLRATRTRLIAQVRRNMTRSGYISAKDAIQLRRDWDKLVNWERTTGSRMPVTVRTAYEEAANALRHEIGEQIPGMKEANAKYHFWTGVNQILKDKENQQVGHRVHGVVGNAAILLSAATGYAHGGGEEAVGLAMLAGVVDTVWNSGANLTGSAIAFDRMGDLVRTRNFTAVINRLTAMASPVARKSNPDELLPEPD
jgi:hypothetical protein